MLKRNFRKLLILLTAFVIAVFLASCERKDPNRNYYEVGTVLERNVVFVFLTRKEMDERCGTDIQYQGKEFAYAEACATERGSPRFVYLQERPNVCKENICLTGRHYRVIRMTILDKHSNFCGSKPLCYEGNMLYTYQYNPMNERQMKMTGEVIAEMIGFPKMFNDSDELGHEIYSHTFNMGGTH